MDILHTRRYKKLRRINKILTVGAMSLVIGGTVFLGGMHTNKTLHQSTDKQYESTITDLNGQVRVLKADKDNLNTRLTNTSKLLTASQEQVASLKKELETSNEEVERQKGIVVELKNQVNSLKKELETKSKALDSAGENITTLQAQVNELTSQLKSKTDELTIAQASLTTAESKVTELTKELDIKTAKISELEAEVSKLNARILVLEDEIKQAEDGLTLARFLDLRANSGELFDITASDLAGVKYIPDYTFYRCRNLRSIEIPKSVESIGEEAFFGCDNLVSVVIETGSKLNIGLNRYGFNCCGNLSSINIPSTITNIDTDSFYGTTIEREFATSAQEKTFASNSDVQGVTFNDRFRVGNETSGYVYYQVCSDDATKYVVMNGILSTKPKLVGEIELLNGTVLISANSFMGSTELTSITIPESLTVLCGATFQNCSSLTSINLPDTITSIRHETFFGCTSLSSITIPNSVTTIEHSAFYNCDSLTNIVIPNSVTSIGFNAFYGCDNLTTLTVPSSVTDINRCFVRECKNLDSVYIYSSSSTTKMIYDCSFGWFWACPETLKIHMLKTLNDTSAQEAFGKYWNYRTASAIHTNIIYDLE